MREKKDELEYKTMRVSRNNHKRLIEQRDKFQSGIGGGTWSIDDTLNEIFKILNTIRVENE